MVRRYIDTPTLKKFFKAADDVIEIGQGFVDKKMKEIKEMAEKDKEPSGGTQGTCNRTMNVQFIFKMSLKLSPIIT